MKFSTKGRYALRALVDLAECSESQGNVKKNVTIKEIAERQDISIKYLEALFHTLKSAGIIKSRRGAQGGYILARPPAKISAFEVEKAIEGPISVVECCTSKNFCGRSKKCKTKNLWNEINESIISILKKTTVADLL
ncbi:MAG: Rrf2 family transcriptional regulator [Fibrobacteria bacterium]|nr:Rrf2 family transcriptional regulator [Fibrobacteria bacterium]